MLETGSRYPARELRLQLAAWQRAHAIFGTGFGSSISSEERTRRSWS